MIDAGPHVDELDISVGVEPSMLELPTKSFAMSSIQGTIVYHGFYQNVQLLTHCPSLFLQCPWLLSRDR